LAVAFINLEDETQKISEPFNFSPSHDIQCFDLWEDPTFDICENGNEKWKVTSGEQGKIIQAVNLEGQSAGFLKIVDKKRTQTRMMQIE